MPGEKPPPNPTATLTLHGGPLDFPANIQFERKHGVWFWITCDKRLYWRTIESWGSTRIAVEREAKRLGYQTIWTEHPTPTDP